MLSHAKPWQHVPWWSISCTFRSKQNYLRPENPLRVMLPHCSSPIATERLRNVSSEHTVFLEVVTSAVGFCTASGTTVRSEAGSRTNNESGQLGTLVRWTVLMCRCKSTVRNGKIDMRPIKIYATPVKANSGCSPSLASGLPLLPPTERPAVWWSSKLGSSNS